jgi:hypothetical protein
MCIYRLCDLYIIYYSSQNHLNDISFTDVTKLKTICSMSPLVQFCYFSWSRNPMFQWNSNAQDGVHKSLKMHPILNHFNQVQDFSLRATLILFSHIYFHHES